MRRFLQAAAVVGALALAGTACAGGGGTAGSGGGSGGSGSGRTAAYDTGGTMTMLLPSDPGNLDPDQTVNSATRLVDEFAYDSLLYQAPSGQLVSGLADKWSQSGNTYTLTLRKGVTCSDGSAMTASTVAANIAYIADPANKSPLLGLFVPPGAKASANDSTSTVTISLASPFPFFFMDLSQLGIACQKGTTDRSMLAHGTDGTGPFVLTSAVPNDQYVFTERKGYAWGPGGASTSAPGTPGKLIIRIVQNETTAANLLLGGQANIAEVIGPDRKRVAAAKLYEQGAESPLGELWYNQAAGHPGSSTAVRQALTMALDLNQVGQVLSQGFGQPPTGLVTLTPKVCQGNTAAGNIPSYNTAAAGKLLDQAGWTMGPGGVRVKDGKQLSLSLLYPTDNGGDPADAFQLAAQEWKKIGVNVHLVANTSTGLESVIFGTGVWDVIDIPLTITQPNNAVPFVAPPVPPKGTDFAHIDDASYNSLVASASAKAGSTGCSQWNQAEVSLFKSADVLPFVNSSTPFWGKSAKFSIVAGEIVPTSLRLYKA